MGKEKYTHIKANGIRNELKDIKKVLMQLTDAVEILAETIADKQTNSYETKINHPLYGGGALEYFTTSSGQKIECKAPGDCKVLEDVQLNQTASGSGDYHD